MRIRKPNKRMLEYWLDESETGEIIPIKMPYKYVIESVCDMLGAGKAYMKENWTTSSPYDYWEKACEGKRLMHNDSTYLIKKLLWNLKSYGTEDEFYAWYKQAKRFLKDCYEHKVYCEDY